MCLPKKNVQIYLTERMGASDGLACYIAITVACSAHRLCFCKHSGWQNRNGGLANQMSYQLMPNDWSAAENSPYSRLYKDSLPLMLQAIVAQLGYCDSHDECDAFWKYSVVSNFFKGHCPLIASNSASTKTATTCGFVTSGCRQSLFCTMSQWVKFRPCLLC